MSNDVLDKKEQLTNNTLTMKRYLAVLAAYNETSAAFEEYRKKVLNLADKGKSLGIDDEN